MNHERIDHVQFAMPAGEEERAQVFYRDALGFPELPKPSHLAVRGGAWFESDEVKVHLVTCPIAGHPTKPEAIWLSAS